MPEPYVINVSSLNDFMRCRWRWVARWVVGRVPKDDARPLRFGKLLHQVFEDHFLGQPMSEVIAKYRAEWVVMGTKALDPMDREVAINAIEDLDSFTEPMCLWSDLYQAGPALEVEVPFEVASPFDSTIRFRGRPDRMAPLWGKLFHWQNRSLSSGINFPLYCQLAERSMHEHVYAFAMGKKYPQYVYGGTVMNLLRKLKYRKKATKAQIEAGEPGSILHPVNEILWQGIVPITPSRNEEMMRLATRWAQEMRRTELAFRATGEWPMPNEMIHGGPYNNSIDPYFRVLQGEISLQDDSLFKDRIDMYASSN